jgi:GGDEF domain-containing protein
MSKPLIIEKLEFQPSASVGFSLYPDGGTDAESLLRAADEAMYEVKLAGKMAPFSRKVEAAEAQLVPDIVNGLIRR